MDCYQSDPACSDWTPTKDCIHRKFFAFELSVSKWLPVQVKAVGHRRAIWAVTNLLLGIIHDAASTILLFDFLGGLLILTHYHYGNFNQLDRECWTNNLWLKDLKGWSCRRWWKSLPTSWCSCAFWDSWYLLVHSSDAREPEGVACTSCSAWLQPFQDLPRTHSIYGSASTRGLDRSHSQSCLWRYVPLLPDFPVDWAAKSNSQQFEQDHRWRANPQFRNHA